MSEVCAGLCVSLCRCVCASVCVFICTCVVKERTRLLLICQLLTESAQLVLLVLFGIDESVLVVPRGALNQLILPSVHESVVLRF